MLPLRSEGAGIRRPRQRGEESPDSRQAACRVTPGRGNARESAAESRPPSVSPEVRVKGCGKSAPLCR